MLLNNYNQELLYIDGGIGDFLQHVPFILLNKHHNIRYLVTVHFKGAYELFESFGVRVEKLIYYKTIEEKNRLLDVLNCKEPIFKCPRSIFFDNSPFDMPELVFNNQKPIVGIHLSGSNLSLSIQKQLGMALKSIPNKIITPLLSDDYNILLFGLPDELREVETSSRIKLICYPNIAQSLSYVQQCSLVVASDSSIKSMSSMLKIPTLVWLADYTDPPRDEMFINPYAQTGIMELFRYKNLDNLDEINTGIDLTKTFIKKKL